jgi:WD40 repeat protein
LIDDKWVNQTVSLGNAGDVFGTSVSISGDGNTVAVGAMGAVQNVTNPLRNGYTKVYTKAANGAWTQLGQTLQYDILGDGFGISVALSSSGTILAVGAHGGVVTTGYVRVFRLVDSDWVRLGSSMPANLPSNDRDRIMSLSGDGLTVAVASNDYVKVFTFDVNNDEWMALSDPPISPAEDTVLSLSQDGTTLAVGSWQRDLVRILNYRNGSWVITKDIIGGKIGFSVSVSPGGNYLAVGGVHTVQIFALEDNQWVELRNTGIHRVKLSYGSAVALSSENGLSIVTGNPSGLGQIDCYLYGS